MIQTKKIADLQAENIKLKTEKDTIVSTNKETCKEMLKEAGVAITPGLDFDSQRGKQTIRFSYARTTNEIKEGIKRITEFMEKF